MAGGGAKCPAGIAPASIAINNAAAIHSRIKCLIENCLTICLDRRGSILRDRRRIESYFLRDRNLFRRENHQSRTDLSTMLLPSTATIVKCVRSRIAGVICRDAAVT